MVQSSAGLLRQGSRAARLVDVAAVHRTTSAHEGTQCADRAGNLAEVSVDDETAQLARGFPKVEQITCITIHIHMYGDTGDLLHFWESLSEGLTTVII